MLMTNLLVAFGTIAVAIVAVLRHSVRFRFLAPKFDLHYNENDIDILNGKAWFHLQILVPIANACPSVQVAVTRRHRTAEFSKYRVW